MSWVRLMKESKKINKTKTTQQSLQVFLPKHLQRGWGGHMHFEDQQM